MEDHVNQLSEYLEKGSISNKSVERAQSPVSSHYYHDQNCGDGFNQDSKSKRSSKMDLPSSK